MVCFFYFSLSFSLSCFLLFFREFGFCLGSCLVVSGGRKGQGSAKVSREGRGGRRVSICRFFFFQKKFMWNSKAEKEKREGAKGGIFHFASESEWVSADIGAGLGAKVYITGRRWEVLENAAKLHSPDDEGEIIP